MNWHLKNLIRKNRKIKQKKSKMIMKLKRSPLMIIKQQVSNSSTKTIRKQKKNQTTLRSSRTSCSSQLKPILKMSKFMRIYSEDNLRRRKRSITTTFSWERTTRNTYLLTCILKVARQLIILSTRILLPGEPIHLNHESAIQRLILVVREVQAEDEANKGSVEDRDRVIAGVWNSVFALHIWEKKKNRGTLEWAIDAVHEEVRVGELRWSWVEDCVLKGEIKKII